MTRQNRKWNVLSLGGIINFIKKGSTPGTQSSFSLARRWTKNPRKRFPSLLQSDSTAALGSSHMSIQSKCPICFLFYAIDMLRLHSKVCHALLAPWYTVLDKHKYQVSEMTMFPWQSEIHRRIGLCMTVTSRQNVLPIFSFTIPLASKQKMLKRGIRNVVLPYLKAFQSCKVLSQVDLFTVQKLAFSFCKIAQSHCVE